MSSTTKEATLTLEQVLLHRFGSPEVLQIEKSDFQPNAKNGLLIEVWAIGVGYVDVMAQRGGYFLAPKLPFSPGYEFVGKVINSYGAENFHEGDLVAALLPQLGAYRNLIEVPADRLVKLPAGINLLKSTAAILNYLTAYCILEKKAKIKEGDTVLIHGASGGVGTALAQIGRLKKLKMYGTASKAKHTLLEDLGVSPIDYRREDFVRLIKQKHPKGIDAAFDPIGGENLNRSARIVKRGGVVVSYGFSGSNYGGYWELFKGILQIVKLNLIPNGKRIVGCGTPGETEKDSAWYRTTLAKIFNQILVGQLDPIIETVYPLEKVQDAHASIESRRVKGKVLLKTAKLQANL